MSGFDIPFILKRDTRFSLMFNREIKHLDSIQQIGFKPLLRCLI